MAKKIGRINKIILLLIMSFSSAIMSLSVRLSVADTFGKPLQQVGVGIPFLIEIEVDSNNSSKPQLSIDNFVIHEQGVSQYTTIMNGRAQVKKQYRYIAKAMQVGTFELGPVRIEAEGSQIVSNIITIQVGDRPINEQQNEEQDPVRLHLYADKSKAYVGEKINVKLRIYLIEPVEIHNLLAPEIAGAYMYDAGKPIKGIEKIDHKNYEYIEQGLEIYPQKPGQLQIPAATVLCNVPIKNKRHADFFGSMASMFGFASEQKFYSNGLNIAIEPIPICDKKIHAVGMFTSYEVNLDPKNAKQGEGIVFTITLVGDGDLEHIDWPDIQLPDGLRAYESKSFLTSENSKKFEYIIQGEKAGLYEINDQSFNFFNPHTKECYSLTTKPIKLQIFENENKIEQNKHHLTVQGQDQDKVVDAVLGNLSYNPTIQTDYFLPMNIFIWILVIPLLSPFFYLIWHRFQRIYKETKRRKNAFKKAYYLLNQYKSKKVEIPLYDIFHQLFIESGCISNELSLKTIEDYLKKRQIDASIVGKWNQFFKLLIENKFYTQSINREDLIDHSFEWISYLETII